MQLDAMSRVQPSVVALEVRSAPKRQFRAEEVLVLVRIVAMRRCQVIRDILLKEVHLDDIPHLWHSSALQPEVTLLIPQQPESVLRNGSNQASGRIGLRIRLGDHGDETVEGRFVVVGAGNHVGEEGLRRPRPHTLLL